MVDKKYLEEAKKHLEGMMEDIHNSVLEKINDDNKFKKSAIKTSELLAILTPKEEQEILGKATNSLKEFIADEVERISVQLMAHLFLILELRKWGNNGKE